jgi:hypothetical protein
MSFPQPNPYASPVGVGPTVDAHGLPPDVVNKAEAIIKDAGQFWLAIIICICCSALGSIIIGPWYLVRFNQWNTLAKTYPQLREHGAPHGSLPQRFQGAKIKLILGMSFGLAMLCLWGLVLVINVLAAK